VIDADGCKDKDNASGDESEIGVGGNPRTGGAYHPIYLFRIKMAAIGRVDDRVD
jgi:hypothetical protein